MPALQNRNIPSCKRIKKSNKTSPESYEKPFFWDNFDPKWALGTEKFFFSKSQLYHSFSITETYLHEKNKKN